MTMKPKGIGKFCRENNIELLVLFGSGATETTHAGSDIDLAVLLKRGSRISKLRLIGGLDELFNGKNIDLVVLTIDTDPLLLYEIFSHGKPLYESAEAL
ncbi:MAG: nucleotidyltransferase domain-containing protein [Nitrospirae bacterium]|nr:nucleotidyltransferase domain-containing protein [Nitrospirota bacterium]